MLSMLFMTTFSEPDPMLFAERPKADLFGRVLTGPQVDSKTNTVITPTRVDAVASVKKEEKDDKAQTYFTALTDARNASKIKDGDKTVGQFTITHFATNAGNALLKFGKTAAEGTKTVLTCVIDLASVGKTEANVGTADKVSASWLNYFWNLWNSKNQTFENADFTPATQQRVTAFSESADSGWSDFKGMIPRTWAKNQIDKETEEGKAARMVEVRNYIPTLLRIPYAKDLIDFFSNGITKILDALGEIITNEYNTDENDPLSPPTKGHKLNKEFFEVGQNTFLRIAAERLSLEEVEVLRDEALEKMKKIAEKYKKV